MYCTQASPSAFRVVDQGDNKELFLIPFLNLVTKITPSIQAGAGSA